MPCAGDLFEALFGPKIGLKKFRLAPKKKWRSGSAKMVSATGHGPNLGPKKAGKNEKKGSKTPPKMYQKFDRF